MMTLSTQRHCIAHVRAFLTCIVVTSMACMACMTGTALPAAAQQTQSPLASGHASLPQDPDTTAIVATSFTEPTRPVNPNFGRTLGGCLSAFNRILALDAYDHPLDLTPAHDTLVPKERLWNPYPPAAIRAARDCYHAVYRIATDIPDIDVLALWPFAVAMNDDSLVQVLTARRLAMLGTDTTARAAWLAKTVHGLVMTAGPDREMHMTEGHVALARQSLAQLEAMGPAHINAWLDALDDFTNAGAIRLDSDSAIQAAIDHENHILSVIHTTPTQELSSRDRKRLAEIEYEERMAAQELTFVKSLDQADLMRFLQLVDSGIPTMRRAWLTGSPAPALSANYWFGTPGNTAPAAAPAPQAVSLIVFMKPTAGGTATGNPAKDAMLRRLHADYPALQIILMAVTKGHWANESLLDHPEHEAQLIYHYVHDSLQVPGIVGVLAGKQQVVTSDGTTLPVQLPLLNEYKMDVSQFMGWPFFLVDRHGIVVDQGRSLVALVPRLLGVPARVSAAQ